MNKFWVIFFHTYTSKLKTKQFLITSVVIAIVLVAGSNIQNIIDRFQSKEVQKVAVLDASGQLFEPLAKQLDLTTDHLQLVEDPKTEADAITAVRNGEYKGYLLLSLNDQGLPQATYKAEKIAEQKTSGELKQALQQVKVVIAAQQLGLNPEQVAQAYSPVSFEQVALSKNAKSEKELWGARGLVYAIVILMFFMIMMYGMMIAMEVVKEKSSRVMEILVSSVSPVKQLFGKICGVALLGLTQMVFLFIVGYFSVRTFTLGPGRTGQIVDFLSSLSVPLDLIVYAIVFLILGFLLYATLLSMLASLIDRAEEAQQMLTPVTFLLLIGFYIAIFGLNTPEATFITVTSFIPFFAPMIMILRIGVLSIPFWQVAISLVILIVTITILAIIGARVYRGGVMLYGKSSLVKSLKQAFALSKSER